MAIRYVKDFEFPSAAGYTKSAPSKVTGQMFAKGGKVVPKAAPAPKAAPKGIMVMIGIGKPAKGPMKKAEGSDQSEFSNSGYDRDRLNEMMNDIAATSEAERIMRKPTPTPKTTAPKKPSKGSPYIPGTNIKPDPDYMKGLEEGAHTPTYKSGGKVAKVMGEFKSGELHSGSKKGPKVSNPKQAVAIALSEAGKAKKAAGGMAQKVQMAKTNAIAESLKGQKKTPYAKGGMAKHDDVKEDKALIKSMVKPAALRKAKGGKTCYADGGEAQTMGAYEAGNTLENRMSRFPAAGNVASPQPVGPLSPPPMAPPVRPPMAPPSMGAPRPNLRQNMQNNLNTISSGVQNAIGRMGRPAAPAAPMAPRPVGGQIGPRTMMKKGGEVMHKAKGGIATPLQSAALAPRMPNIGRAKGVPVASANPMIDAAPSAGPKGIGVNAKRPGGPNVGAIRAALAKRASQAMPDNAPSMMKKGGKVK